MAYTEHGHHIQGTSREGVRPVKVMRCGGPGHCAECSADAVLKKNGPLSVTLHIEHHDSFTAVYMYGQLACMSFVGTREQREAMLEPQWAFMATTASQVKDL